MQYLPKNTFQVNGCYSIIRKNDVLISGIEHVNWDHPLLGKTCGDAHFEGYTVIRRRKVVKKNRKVVKKKVSKK
jgi:hypothetical protein